MKLSSKNVSGWFICSRNWCPAHSRKGTTFKFNIAIKHSIVFCGTKDLLSIGVSAMDIGSLASVSYALVIFYLDYSFIGKCP